MERSSFGRELDHLAGREPAPDYLPRELEPQRLRRTPQKVVADGVPSQSPSASR
jgi:hypothetical protein